jgi:ribosomal protein L15E
VQRAGFGRIQPCSSFELGESLVATSRVQECRGESPVERRVLLRPAVPAARETFPEDRNGFVVPPYRVERLAELEPGRRRLRIRSGPQRRAKRAGIAQQAQSNADRLQ